MSRWILVAVVSVLANSDSVPLYSEPMYFGTEPTSVTRRPPACRPRSDGSRPHSGRDGTRAGGWGSR